MSYNRTPLQIIADGITQFCMYAPTATDHIANLRGAYGYAEATGRVLRDETLNQRKSAAITVGHIIPQIDAQEVEEESREHT